MCMKKIVFLLSILGLFLVGNYAHACKRVEGVVYPTIDSVLQRDDIAIGVYQPQKNGPVVVARRIIGNNNAREELTLKTNASSCTTRSDDFRTNEYIVAVLPKEDLILEELDLDNQFSIAFLNKEEALVQYHTFLDTWNDFLFLSSDEVSYTPTDYTLRPGLKHDDDVKLLQRALKKILQLGDDFKIDGSYGPMTISAVKQFQREHGLKEDGLAGKVTQGKIREALGDVVTQSDESETSNSSDPTTPKEETQNQEDTEANNDIIDEALKKVFSRAKNEIMNYAHGANTFTDAYSIVVKYNNEALQTYSSSDPLYYASHNGTHFVYYGKLKNGKYVCVDDVHNEILINDRSPDLEVLDVSC